MKTLKERMLKIDKICSKLNLPETKTLFRKKQNKSLILKEQDQNINNYNSTNNISNNVGCIITRSQLIKQSTQVLQCDTVRSQTISLKQLKIREEEQINLQTQKEELQNQINQLVQIKKQMSEDKKKKQFITQDTQLLTQMLKLQQEKLAIQNEISQIDNKIEQVKYTNLNKFSQFQKLNWKEEKKTFQQKWLDLEQNQDEDKFFDDTIDQKILDNLQKEVDELLCLKLPEEQDEQQQQQQQQQQQISQRSKLNMYQSPLQTIEEEQSVELSFQKI